MKCPNCQVVLTEDVPVCPSCGFSFQSIGGEFGRMPMVKGVLTDPERVLTHRQGGKIRRAISRFVRQFPQLKFHVILLPVASEISMAKYSFWIFNGGNFCSDLHKGGLNYHNLLVIDVAHQRACLSIGYGLEPFIEESDLGSVLAAGEAALRAGAYGEAVHAILEAATATWHAKGDLIPQTFGLRRKNRSLGEL